MWTRRHVLASGLLAGGAALLGRALRAFADEKPGEKPAGEGPRPAGAAYTRVVVPNGPPKLPFTMKDGVKEFHLVAEAFEQEFAPGFKVKCWGYNGRTPGPTIEAVEGDRVRILVTNNLPEPTSVHWHGVILPSGMDGIGGLNQPYIKPGETYAYEFTLRQHGTQMYHPHADEMLQMAVGMMGFFVIHPKGGYDPPIDRDFAIFLQEWAIHPGTYRPDPSIMVDFNIFSFNGKVFPATEPLVAGTGNRVRVRIANLNMDSHPIHLHGHSFRLVATDGGPIPPSAQQVLTTVNVPVGSTADIEFVANPGDWGLHCHKNHHVMNGMGHGIPITLGANQAEVEKRIRALLPGYMAMGEKGMSGMQEMAKHMPGPKNTLPMMGGEGPFGNMEMGGMFTVLKVRDNLKSFEDPGWYEAPVGTRAYKVS